MMNNYEVLNYESPTDTYAEPEEEADVSNTQQANQRNPREGLHMQNLPRRHISVLNGAPPHYTVVALGVHNVAHMYTYTHLIRGLAP